MESLPKKISKTELIVKEEEEEEELCCLGCRDGIFNQLGHMDRGGCLYNPENS